MERKELQRLAVRTESVTDRIELNVDDKEYFIAVLEIVTILIDEVLDVYKKHIFYGKEIDYTAVSQSNLTALDKFTDVALNPPSRMLDVISGESEYDKHVNKTTIDMNVRVFHALLGTITEHGEISKALLEGLETGNLDLVNVCEELGDSDWYKALFYEATGISWDDVDEMTIKKLEERFKDKIYNSEEARNRNPEEERKILEAQIKGQVDYFLSQQ